MGEFEKQRKSMPVPSGSIPYWRHYELDGCTYSIDKCRLRFPLRWGQLRLIRGDELLLLNDLNMISAFTDSLIRWCGYFPEAYSGRGRFGGNVLWVNYGGVIVSLHKFKSFGSDEFNYSCILEFNPNKHFDNHCIYDIVSGLRETLGDWFCWASARIDFALDIPYPISDVRLLSRKESSCYMGTYYFGKRGQNGYTRVYDKHKQMIDVFRTDIGTEVTRIEWEAYKGQEVCYDVPHLIKDLGKHEVLRFVPMDAWPVALRTFDPKTAAKIKSNCLRVIKFDSSLFCSLRESLYQLLGLDMACNIDRLDSKRKDVAAMSDSDLEDLDRIAAALRKFAEIHD